MVDVIIYALFLIIMIVQNVNVIFVSTHSCSNSCKRSVTWEVLHVVIALQVEVAAYMDS